tara:strand:- start:15804 stop:16022 length:219 start_codon:yes stop_codon:yes gene_type:complete
MAEVLGAIYDDYPVDFDLDLGHIRDEDERNAHLMSLEMCFKFRGIVDVRMHEIKNGMYHVYRAPNIVLGELN